MNDAPAQWVLKQNANCPQLATRLREGENALTISVTSNRTFIVAQIVYYKKN